MFGRRGQGPGELIRPTNAAWLDSTLIVKHNLAVTEFRPDGEFVRLMRPPIRGWVSAVVSVGRDEYVVLKDGVARTSGIDSLQELFFIDGGEARRLATGVSGGMFTLRSDGGAAGALNTGLCGTLSIAYTGGGKYIVGDGARGRTHHLRQVGGLGQV
jgi:hypothetical protein